MFACFALKDVEDALLINLLEELNALTALTMVSSSLPISNVLMNAIRLDLLIKLMMKEIIIVKKNAITNGVETKVLEKKTSVCHVSQKTVKDANSEKEEDLESTMKFAQTVKMTTIYDMTTIQSHLTFVSPISNVMEISHLKEDSMEMKNTGLAQNAQAIGITKTFRTVTHNAKTALMNLATAHGVPGTLTGEATNALNAKMEQFMIPSQETVSVNAVD